MIEAWKCFFLSLYDSLKPGCRHMAEVSIDESGDGSVTEWECIHCGDTRVDVKDE